MKKSSWQPALVLLLAAYPALATPPVTTRDKDKDEKAKPLTVSGCLERTDDDGVYRIKSPAREVEVRGSAGLEKHVGRQVKVTGQWIEDVGPLTGGETEPADRSHLKAGTVKDVARTCDRTR